MQHFLVAHPVVQMSKKDYICWKERLICVFMLPDTEPAQHFLSKNRFFILKDSKLILQKRKFRYISSLQDTFLWNNKKEHTTLGVFTNKNKIY